MTSQSASTRGPTAPRGRAPSIGREALSYPVAAVGHMPFAGHRKCSEWFHDPYYKASDNVTETEYYVKRPARNQKLIEEAGKLVGRWR